MFWRNGNIAAVVCSSGFGVDIQHIRTASLKSPEKFMIVVLKDGIMKQMKFFYCRLKLKCRIKYFLVLTTFYVNIV